MSGPTRPLPSPTLSITTLLLALALGITVGIVARGENVLVFDVDLTTAIQQAQGQALGTIADVANVLGSTAGAAVAISVALIVAGARSARWELIFLATLLALRLAGTQLKPLFDSPRPTDDLVTVVGTWDGTGYPSGHALSASTMTLGLAVIAWRHTPSRGRLIGTMAALATLALVIGWARIWSGAHWATDVLGGYAFGVAIVAMAVFLVDTLSRRYPAVA